MNMAFLSVYSMVTEYNPLITAELSITSFATPFARLLTSIVWSHWIFPPLNYQRILFVLLLLYKEKCSPHSDTDIPILTGMPLQQHIVLIRSEPFLEVYELSIHASSSPGYRIDLVL